MKCDGCKNEVTRLWKHPRLEAAGFPDGLCVTCYQIEKDTWARDEKPAGETETAPPKTEPLAPRQKRKYVRRSVATGVVPGVTPQTEPLRQKRKYVRRDKGAVKQKRQYRRRVPTLGAATPVDRVMEVREQWAAKLATAEKDVLLFQCRLDVVDELLAQIGEAPPSRAEAQG